MHDELGYNYRMPNINAALGCAQLEQLPGFLESKRTLFERYRDAFAPVPGVRMFAEREGCRSNYWLQTLLLDESIGGRRDELLAATNAAGYQTRPARAPMHTLAPSLILPAGIAAGCRKLAAPDHQYSQQRRACQGAIAMSHFPNPLHSPVFVERVCFLAESRYWSSGEHAGAVAGCGLLVRHGEYGVLALPRLRRA